MSSNLGNLKLYVFGFAESNLWLRELNAFERSVSKAPKTLPLSADIFHVSTIRQYWVLYPVWKLHCWFDKILLKKADIWANIHFSKKLMK